LVKENTKLFVPAGKLDTALTISLREKSNYIVAQCEKAEVENVTS